MSPGLLNQPDVERQVVDRRDLQPQDLVRGDQVSQVSFTIKPVDERGTILLQRGEVVFPPLVAHIHYPLFGEDLARCRPLRVGKTQSNISTPRSIASSRFSGLPTPHQVARFIFRQDIVHQLYHLVHRLGGFAHGQSTDGVAGCLLGGNLLGARRRRSG